jgi:cyclic pyranopterin phosphate synthase
MEKKSIEKPLGQVNYLRLSITDRCNLRCFYCAPAQGWKKLPAPEILRYEEMLHLARVAVGQGIRKIRVTGGEPLVRRGVVEFIQGLHQVRKRSSSPPTGPGMALPYAAGLRHST